MAFASLGARTPFITSTPSNAVTLASPGVVARFGLVAAGVASAPALVEFSFAVFASLLPAITGKAVMASTNRLDIHTFTFNIDGVSFFPPNSGLGTTRGVKLTYLRERCQDDCMGGNQASRAPLGPWHSTWTATLLCFGDDAVTTVTDHCDSHHRSLRSSQTRSLW